MQKEYIDVDYTMLEEDDKKKNPDVIINTDPASAAISGVVGVVNNVTNAIKECASNRKSQKEQLSKHR